MSKSRPPAKADDRDASAVNAVANEGESETHVSEATRYRMVLCQLQNAPKFSAEWFLLKDEELQLRIGLAVKGHSIKSPEVGEHDDHDVGTANVDRVSTSTSDRQSRNSSGDDSSSLIGGFLHTQSYSQEGERMFADVNLDTIVSTNPTPSSESVTAIEPDSLTLSRQRTKGMFTVHSLSSPSVNGTCVHDLQDKPVPTTNAGIEAATETLDDGDDEPPHVPCSLVSHTLKDGQVSKE